MSMDGVNEVKLKSKMMKLLPFRDLIFRTFSNMQNNDVISVSVATKGKLCKF